MNKTCIFILLIILLISCAGKENKYPQIITSNNITNEYDYAKWLIYQSNFISKGVYINPRGVTYFLPNVNATYCDLKLNNIDIKKDTFLFTFSFVYPDSAIECTPKNIVINQIMYIKSDNYFYRLSSASSFIPELMDSSLKLIKKYDQSDTVSKVHYGYRPLKLDSIEFIKFIRTTKYPLNNWLKDEAKKRGITN
jgi:hypothetical protein